MSSIFSAIILAAGQGTRMKSALPKVLHRVAGRPLVAWPVNAAGEAGARDIVVVVGHGREMVAAELDDRFGARVADASERRIRFEATVSTAIQHEQRGTGHAVMCGLDALAAREGYVVILYGDCPLLDARVVSTLVESARQNNAKLAMLVGALDDPTGYGRIVRDEHGHVAAIVEQKDCSAAERAIREVNPGVYCMELSFLRDAVTKLDTNNAQGELYLTDVVAQAAKLGAIVDVPWSMEDLRGINDRYELSEIDAIMRKRIAKKHALAGVTVRDPSSAYIEADVEIEPDAVIEPNVTLRGRTRVRAGAIIDVGCVLDDVVVHAGARLKPYTVATDSEIGERAQIGPFSHLRPKSKLSRDVHIGNFVETKATTLGAGSKANHLAYLGDGQIGEGVNVGAGTIFCNYDGFRKHTTVLEDGVFIGSDSQLVAPVRVGKGAYVGTGTTVTKDVPPDALAIGRTRQENKEGYASRLRSMKGKP